MRAAAIKYVPPARDHRNADGACRLGFMLENERDAAA